MPPLVSIGLPVFNGGDYLEEAINSLVHQTYASIEIIISDNHSTDATEEICRRFAASDPRILYVRQERNLGAAPNYDFVFEQANGEYFKWMAHDDVCRPRFIEVCVAALEHDPDAVLAYPSIQDIDEDGNLMGACDVGLDLDHSDPAERFRRTMRRPHKCVPVFGVMRPEVLAATAGHGNYQGSDRNLLGELALHGKLVEVPELLLLHREHSERYSISMTTDEERLAWLDTARTPGVGFPDWRRLREYIRAIRRAPIALRSRVEAYWWMVRWSWDKRTDLIRDITRKAR